MLDTIALLYCKPNPVQAHYTKTGSYKPTTKSADRIESRGGFDFLIIAIDFK